MCLIKLKVSDFKIRTMPNSSCKSTLQEKMIDGFRLLITHGAFIDGWNPSAIQNREN